MEFLMRKRGIMRAISMLDFNFKINSILYFYALILFSDFQICIYVKFSSFFPLKKLFIRPINSSFSSSVFLARNSSSQNSSIPREKRGITMCIMYCIQNKVQNYKLCIVFSHTKLNLHQIGKSFFGFCQNLLEKKIASKFIHNLRVRI